MMLWRRLQYLLPWRRRMAERDMHEELRSLAAMAAPGELGNLTLAAEDARAEWGWTRLERTAQDLRYALRALGKSPAFTATAVISLAAGIGVTTVIFSAVTAVLVRPLQYADSDRLIRIIERRPPDAASELGYPQQLASIQTADLPAFRSRATTLSHVGAFAGTAMTLGGRDEPIRVQVARVSPSVLAMLGVHPVLGRMFEPREETPGADTSAIVSHAAWRRYFGSSHDVLGQSLTLDGRSFAVVGVMPDGFRFPDPQTELWIPYALGAARGRVSPIARLADGVSRQAASAQVDGILAQLQAAASPRKARASTFEVQSVQEQLVAPIRPALTVLAIAVGAVLLVACVNVANLLLARTVARRREIAVRVALGAGRGRLARQLLTESLLLAIAGAAAGTGLAIGGLQLLRTLGTSLGRADLTPGVSIPRLDEIAIDPVVLAATLAVVVLTNMLFGVVPALRQSRARLTDHLRDGVSSAQAGFNVFRRNRMRGLLVIAQIAIAMLLLVAGGLLMRSFIKLSNVEPGYDPANLLTFNVPAVGKTPPSFNEELAARLRTMPGVRSVGYAELMPMVRFRSGIPIKPVQPSAPAATLPGPIDSRTVSHEFLAAMGVPVVAGRGFTETDGTDQPKVILINRTLARSGFLGSNPIGAKVSAGPFHWEVIGVVDDVRQYGLDQNADPQVFFDIRQLPAGNPSPYLAVRTDSDPAALASSIRAIVRDLNPSATVDNLATMEQVVSNSMSRSRLVAVLAGIFAGVAGLLAVVGIYGLIAYAVAERTREFGIRIALGATRGNVIRLVLGQSALLIGAGLTLGVAAAAAITRQLQGLLFGLTPLDPATFIAMAVMFGMAATLASYLPGRRATRVDPIVALRND